MMKNIVLVLFGVLLACVLGNTQDVQILSPEITFRATEVFFRDSVTYLGPGGVPHVARSALKLMLYGKDFYDGATGPYYYLGRYMADRHYTSPDGKSVAVYFYDLKEIPERGRIRIQTRVDEFVKLKQLFVADSVEWLSSEIRKLHDLPDLQSRVAADSLIKLEE